MNTAEENSRDVYETLDPSLHQYYEMASNSDETPQPVFDEIAANEERYTQGVLINQGGMKQIIKTTDSLTGRPVAMAVLHDPENPQKVERFLREARLTAALEHPNIIPVYDIGLNDSGDPFFTMKLIGGRSLADIIKSLSKEENSEFNLQTLIDVFIKICDAIAYAHSKGVLHLDLKPENIRVGEFGEVLVCDWGLAKVIESPEEVFESDLDPCLYNDITLHGVIKGTPGFMAPEQIETKLGEKNRTTDVYALGGILYSLLIYRAPVASKEIQQVLDDTLSGKIIKPSERVKDRYISNSLEAVAMKALAVDQNNRYQNVQDLRNEIYKWIGGFATAAENAGFTKSFWLLFKRHKAVGFLTLIIIISTIFSIFKIKENEAIALKNAVEAKQALELYEEEKRQTEIIGREASPRLVYQSKQALNSFEFNKALKLVNKAIDRDPQNEVAHLSKGRIHFYRQEFNQALKSFSLSGKHQKHRDNKKMINLAKKYSSKADNQLLSAQDLIDILKRYQNKNNIHKLFRYTTDNYVSLEDQLKICEFMLAHNNPQVKNLKFIHQIKEDFISIDISENVAMSNISALRNLPLDSLNVSNSAVWQDWVITDLPLTNLDISKTKFKTLKKILQMKTLKTLTVTKKQWPKIKAPLSSDLVIVKK